MTLIKELGDITAKLFRIAGDTGVITKGISAPIAKFNGTTNDIILQGLVIGIDPMPNIRGMDIPAGITKGEAGEELTDASIIS